MQRIRNPLLSSAALLSPVAGVAIDLRGQAIDVAQGIAPLRTCAAFAFTCAETYRDDKEVGAYLLPAYFALLDPTDIEAVSHRADPDRGLRLVAVLASLEGVAGVGTCNALPASVLPDLWSRAWQWIRFFTHPSHYDLTLGLSYHFLTHTTHPNLSFDPSHPHDTSEVFGAAHRAEVFASVLRNCCTNELENGSVEPSVCAAIGKVWVVMVEDENLQGMLDVAEFLRAWFLHDSWPVACFDALVDGVGGSRMDLARLLLRHLAVSLRHSPYYDGDEYPPTQGALLEFLLVSTGFLGSSASGDAMLRDLLLGLDVIGPLTELGALAMVSSNPEAEDVVVSSLRTVLFVLGTSSSADHVLQAIRAGILQAVVNFASESNYLAHLVRDTLPRKTLDPAVFRALRREFLSLDSPVLCASLPHDEDRRSWEELRSLVESRAIARQSSRPGPKWRCAGVQMCGITVAQYKCAGCMSVLYCSRQCQKNHWKAGHRRVCGAYYSLQHIIRRGRPASGAFHEQVLTLEVRTHRREIDILCSASPYFAIRRFYLAFDFRLGACNVECRSLQELALVLNVDAAEVLIDLANVTFCLLLTTSEEVIYQKDNVVFAIPNLL
ncbi:hypothetical protein K438DRAFT_1975932 [Mycena galopus ATCC 62051]|nr:hypothetical protein K438DRAFT_1975932 [Mycena galopus ATCC 62051]